MVRSNDPFWNYVEEMNDGSVKCKFCWHPFAKDTSISRIKWHLSGEKGHGVAICGQVPKEVQEAAFLAMRGGNKRQKTIANSSNVNNNAISFCPQVENNEVVNLAGDAERIQIAVQGTEQVVGDGRTSLHAESGNLRENMAGEMMHIDTRITAEERIVDADETREAPQAPDLAGQSMERRLDEISHWLMEDDTENGTGGVAQPGAGASSSGGLLQPGAGATSSEGLLQPGAGPSSSGELLQPCARASSSGGLLQPVVGLCSSEGLLQPGAGATSSEGLLQPGAGPSSAGGLLQPCAGASSSGGLLQPVAGPCSSGGLLQPVGSPSSSGGLLHPVVGPCSSGGLMHNIRVTIGDALPTCSTKLVGEAFEKNKNEILSWLMNDEVSRIGIYGMGGVGKSTLLKHIHNQLLEESSHHVYWVTVSKDFSINSLQDLIAKCLKLDLSNENDELRRAVNLSKELKKRKKWVLILDDLWKSFELHEVGIPDPMEGCKLILTTRSLDVCRRMGCIQKIKVKVLSDKEAWTLFMEKLTHDVILSPKVEQVAECVMRECAGLPLGIITVARSMRGVDDLHEWRNTLEKLKQSKCRDMEDVVFGALKSSYDRLNDFALQQCLLYCALFPEDYRIRREDLISYLIDEGIIKGMDSRQAEFDEGHTMLNKLENFCLLESCIVYSGERAVKMHDLIRDIAHQILQTKSPVMVGKELPDVDKWKEDRVRLSPLWGDLKEIPSSHSTLLLNRNFGLRFIADSFFKELRGLKVLDLSCTGIKNLPDSVSDLVSLNALLLKECYSLRDVPSLKKLRTLKRLDLSGTSLEKMPQGLECLSNLRYLRLNGCGEKEFPSGILPKLSHLQVLIIEEYWVTGTAVTVKGKEVACLRKLETLECRFEHFSDFVEFIKFRDGTQGLSKYKIRAGKQLGGFDYLQMDLSRTSLEKMPQGLECLSSLRYLRLNRGGEKEFPSGILPKLSHLQVLIIEELLVDKEYAPVTVKVEEVACLRKLETLECCFEHLSEVAEFIKYRDGTQSLSKYKIRAGRLIGFGDGIDKRVVLGKLSINRDGDFQFKFPNNLEEMVIFDCNDANANLYDVPSLIKYASKLMIIKDQ